MIEQPKDYDPHGGADCYGNADGTIERRKPASPRVPLAVLGLFIGAYLLGIGIGYLLEYARLVMQ